MKKIILLTFILLFQSFSSFGNPNGKGLICECKLCPNYKIEFGSYFEGKRPSVYGYFLKDNKVTYLQVTNIDNKIFFRKSLYNKEYQTNIETSILCYMYVIIYLFCIW